jgi:glutathione synthase/RimK-type ligase-like ATP-grasp enzyme
MTLILVLSNGKDQGTNLTCARWDREGVRYFRFDTETFPNSRKITWTHLGGRAVLSGDIPFDEITSVWYRRPEQPIFADMAEEDRNFSNQESKHFLDGVYLALRDRIWVNPLQPLRSSSNKLLQLETAVDCQLQIPETVVTNDPDEAHKLGALCEWNFIYKPMCSHLREKKTELGYDSVFTNKIDQRRMEADGERIALTPCIFQRYVEKERELRITIFGEQVFCMQIDSQKNQHSTVDWRHYDFRPELYGRFELPSAIRESLLVLIKKLGLVFGCIDMILTPEGKFVFLEINPNGQWHWAETFTGYPMHEAFLHLLEGRR